MEKETFVCTICDKSFENFKKLKLHCLKKKDVEHSKIVFNDDNFNDWVECKICGLRRGKINIHLKRIHGIDPEKYMKEFGSIISKNYLEEIKKNGAKAADYVDDRIYKHKCRYCDNIIEGKDLICSVCKLIKARKNQEAKFANLIESENYVRCQCKLEDGTTCNWPDKRISGHIKNIHGYTTKKYKNEFNAEVICNELKQKTAFRGKHSEETKKKMGESRKGLESWNKNLTADDHPSLEIISQKAKLRLGQLQNNPYHLKVKSGDDHPITGMTNWRNGLKLETSEILEGFIGKDSGMDSHRAYPCNDEISIRNRIINRFMHDQKNKIRLIEPFCFENTKNCTNKIVAHHTIPVFLFDPYDFRAHLVTKLISLCDRCHSSWGQRVDLAWEKCKTLEQMAKECPIEYKKYISWKNHIENRHVPVLPLSKLFIQLLKKDEREYFSKIIFDDIRKVGFPYIYYPEKILIKDYHNVSESKVIYKNNILKNYNSSGFKLKDFFIKQQYVSFHEVFNDDHRFLEVIRDRLGLNENSLLDYVTLSNRILLRTIEKIYPEYSFSKYQPAIAKWIIDEFCESEKIYDYSSGYGARLIAATCCDRDYIGINNDIETVKQLRELKNWLKKNDLINSSIKIYNRNATEFKPKQVNFIYSSPDFSRLEQYKYMSYEDEKFWINEYMTKIIKKSYISLNENGKFVCHIGMKFVEQLKNILNKEGFKEISIIDVSNKYCAYSCYSENVNEAILVYQK